MADILLVFILLSLQLYHNKRTSSRAVIDTKLFIWISPEQSLVIRAITIENN